MRITDFIRNFVERRPKFKFFLRNIFIKFPRLYLLLERIFYKSAPISLVLKKSKSFAAEEKMKLGDNYKLLKNFQRNTIYFYVEHTVQFPTNTGVQRVTRGLAKGLQKLEKHLIYIKWDPSLKQCVTISQEELKHLALWNGPAICDCDLEFYASPKVISSTKKPETVSQNSWLIVPEVPHITFHSKPVTLDLIIWAKQLSLKTGFIFYDATPLRREELKEMYSKHEKYMQHLSLADCAWSISKWSQKDIEVYWRQSHLVPASSLPKVETQFLAGEVTIAPRVRSYQAGQEIILSVGSIDPHKNQLKLIESFLNYCEQNPDTTWKLYLVGNLHPSLSQKVHQATKKGKIIYKGFLPDNELVDLYSKCSFTVFPSVQEGFGLPILESLWFGKPCICANFGSMAEVARRGGCLTLDVKDAKTLQEGIATLISNTQMLEKLSIEAMSVEIKSWKDYAQGICNSMAQSSDPRYRLGTIYFWVDATLAFRSNTGIQRVARQLARSLQSMGLNLIPVKWGGDQKILAPLSDEELVFLSNWNGPDASKWGEWKDPNNTDQACFFMPELPLNHAPFTREKILTFVKSKRMSTASIFFDAIPWKMRDIYPPANHQAHYAYMMELQYYDLVFPISSYSRKDLVRFLGFELEKPQSLENKIQEVLLPGEFSQISRAKLGPESPNNTFNILCVGTVEPRKNHKKLLLAFSKASSKLTESDISLNLVIAGGAHSIQPNLGDEIKKIVDDAPNIQWEENIDDQRLNELYQHSHFTIYPSVEEGFGLPILESLWNGRPCICANFGSMKEVASEGGCILTDVRSIDKLTDSICEMVTNRELYDSLVQKALTMNFKSWSDYAYEIVSRLSAIQPTLSVSSFVAEKEDFVTREKEMCLQQRPKLSVCITTFNRAEWLSKSLENWSHHYPESLEEVEFIVCDNASTDNTQDIVKPYLQRTDFAYYRNPENVGMLGNLRETAHYAKGEYIWIIGDDDLLLPGSIHRVLQAILENPKLALIYLNYAYTREENPNNVINFEDFFTNSTPIVPPETDKVGAIRNICAQNENFFTAVYTLVFRRDHALKAYSQNTSGRPFSTMVSCIPTTYYVLNNMMAEQGVWIGEPMLVVNLNVSWPQYAPLWILERIPEVYEHAELQGVTAKDIDRWRLHSLPSIVHFFEEIYSNDPLENSAYFQPEKLVRRFKHLKEFRKVFPRLKKFYLNAYKNNHQAAQVHPDIVFQKNHKSQFLSLN